MIKKILIGIVVVIVLFLGFVATRPADFRITRSINISAPPEIVFTQVNDFHKWNDWSPWAKLDPNAKNTFDGADSGVGAGFAWVGNSQVGEGRMTIIESRPNDLIRIKLEFKKPFESEATSEFAFKAEGDQTVLTWTMNGHNNYIGKLMSVCMDCDKMVGGEFEKGLAAIKTIAEGQAKK